MMSIDVRVYWLIYLVFYSWIYVIFPQRQRAGYEPAVWEPGEAQVCGGCPHAAHGHSLLLLLELCFSLLSPPCLAPQAQTKWNLVSPETSPCDRYEYLKDSYYPSIYVL